TQKRHRLCDPPDLTCPRRSRPFHDMATKLHIGTQGWNYDAWVGPFYPEGTRPADFLTVYARAFETVEVDSTLYASPVTKPVCGWVQGTPDDFVFSLKVPEAMTHERRLRGVDELASEFFDRARELEGKLGPILIQLGPDFAPAELPAVAQFLPKLPRDLRFAIEFRQRGGLHDGVLALLAEPDVALGRSEAPGLPRKHVMHLPTPAAAAAQQRA